MIKEINPDFGELVAANDGYCPCAIERTEDTRRMCKDFREQIAKGIAGKCHCELYEGVLEE